MVGVLDTLRTGRNPVSLPAVRATVRQYRRVASLPFVTKAFTTSAVPVAGELPVSSARLVWGAITVGATPMALGGTRRPLIELSWRAAMVEASVAETSGGTRWVRTDSYNRLDRSEKSAVSYFLGMTQAKITCEMLLGVPHLVHLDAVLALLGRSTNSSRPDFVGFDLSSMTYTFAVEAKGRTNDRTDDLIKKAKRQAGLMPTIVHTTSRVRVASVASFDSNSHWHAYLEDPPQPRASQASVTVEELLVAYYRPLVAALLAAEVNHDEGDETTVVGRLPGIDMSLGLPRPVVTIVANMIDRESAAELRSAGADLRGALLDLPGKAGAERSPEQWLARARAEAADPNRCTGLDGVLVVLGPSWPRNPTAAAVR